MVLEAVISQQLLPKQDGTGRVAAFEVMLMNTAIKNLVRESKTQQINGVIQTSKGQGMFTMDDALFDLANNGIISRDVALSYAVDEKDLRKNFQSIIE